MVEANLNEWVLDYQRTGDGLREILAEVAPRIYRYPLTKPGFSEDDCGEYFLFVYPRLLRTLARFQERGKPFEWYLNSVLCWQLKEYRRFRCASDEGWGAAAHPGFWEHEGFPLWSRTGASTSALEDQAEAPLESLRRLCGRPASRAAGRRLLFWALKDPRRLAAADIERLAEASGLSPQFLEGAVRTLEGCILRKEERLHRLYLRRNRAYALCLQLQHRLARELDPARRQEACLRLERARANLHKTLERLEGIRLVASNRQIAGVLQVPKGTVDSSLFWLRRRIAGLQEERSSA